MTELERALVLLGEQLDVPAAPPLAASVRERIRRRRRARRLLVLAVPLAALAIAFAVPPARSAILRFFHIGAEKVEQVEKLPPARNLAPTAGLGPQRTRADAERVAGFSAQLGKLASPRTWWARPGLIATRLPDKPRVLLIELTGEQVGMAKKFATGRVVPTQVKGSEFAIWIQGRHVFTYVGHGGQPFHEVARYAGNALVWLKAGVTYRLEGEPDLLTALHDAERITPETTG
jgi:hypothetical protein